MKIVVAPDKFKGTLTALQVCDAVEQGIHKFDHTFQIIKVPLADGGEGSLDVLQPYLDLRTISIPVKDPLGRTITANYRASQDGAFIEMAEASGLDLLPDSERNCLYTSSFGTGQMILDAYQRGITKIFLFVGGSATCDGGIGILEAMGIRAIGNAGPLPSVGERLPHIERFDETKKKIDKIDITVICDVLNPLYGPKGAAMVYAPQKGANAEAVALLDQGLRNLARVVKEQVGIDIDEFEGAGAAGGVAAGLKAFYPVEIRSGFGAISELVGLPDKVVNADLIITGEGKFDHQTLQGKVIKGVHDLCLQKNKPVAAICGVLELDSQTLSELCFTSVKSLVREDTTFEQASANAFDLVSQRAFELIESCTEP